MNRFSCHVYIHVIQEMDYRSCQQLNISWAMVLLVPITTVITYCISLIERLCVYVLARASTVAFK